MSPRARRWALAALALSLGCGEPATTASHPAADAAPPLDADLPEVMRPDVCVRGAEICNGEDDDCDGLVDEEDPDLRRRLAEDPLSCGVCGRVCAADHATMTCRGGQCIVAACAAGFNDRNRDPADGCESDCFVTNGGRERCDGADNDCDGEVDEDFDLAADPAHCGACDAPCEAPDNAGVACQDGRCVAQDCAPGFVDLDGEVANGCEYACEPTDRDREFCNGLDDDCDGEIDEVDQLVLPENLCGAVGACGPECGDGAAGCAEGERCEDQVCVLQADGPEGAACADDADCTQTHPGYACLPRFSPGEGGAPQVERICGPRPLGPICEGAAGFRCARGPLYQAGDEAGRCDGIDNDCDGQVDEDFAAGLWSNGPGSPPRTCEAGEGACRRTATARCADDGASAVCEVEAAEPEGEDDNCDGRDDDCDGEADEDFEDAWVTRAGYAIYAYEASRPGASAQTPGLDLNPADGVDAFLDTRPCSRPGVLPWADVDFADAAAACARIGARLCTEDEWSAACAGDRGLAYPYGAAYRAQACNGGENDADPERPAVQDAVMSCGALPDCEADGVFDLSGNLKEWTDALRDGLRPVRGGGFTTNAPEGLACAQVGDLKPAAFRSATLGFRCCRDLD